MRRNSSTSWMILSDRQEEYGCCCVLAQILALYLVKFKSSCRVTVVQLYCSGLEYSEAEDQIVLLSEPVIRMLQELDQWSKLEPCCLHVSRVFDSRRIHSLQDILLYTVARSDLYNMLSEEWKTCVDDGAIEVVNLDVFSLSSLELVDQQQSVEFRYNSVGEQEQEQSTVIHSDFVACFSVLISIYNTIGKCTSANRFGLDRFYEQFYVEWMPCFTSSFIASNEHVWNPTTLNREDQRDEQFELLDNRSDDNLGTVHTNAVSVASTIVDPNREFISNIILRPSSEMEDNSQQLVPLTNGSAISDRPGLFSSFKPRMLSDNVDYSHQEVIHSNIYISIGTDYSNGTFIPLTKQRNGAIVISKNHDDHAANMSSLFSSELSLFYQGTLKAKSMTKQMADIKCQRRYQQSTNVFCLTECRYGSSLHPIIRFHCYSHELYCFLNEIVDRISTDERQHDLAQYVMQFEKDMESFYSSAKQFTKVSIETSWSDKVKNNTSQLFKSLISWTTSNYLKNANSIVSNVLSNSNVDVVSILQTTNAWYDQHHHEQKLKKHMEVATQPTPDHTLLYQYNPATTSMAETKALQDTEKLPSIVPSLPRPKKPKSTHGSLQREPQSRRIEIFLNQIFPK